MNNNYPLFDFSGKENYKGDNRAFMYFRDNTYFVKIVGETEQPDVDPENVLVLFENLSFSAVHDIAVNANRISRILAKPDPQIDDIIDCIECYEE